MDMDKIKWQDLELFDSDGCEPCPEDYPLKMREYRDTGGISGYFFVDTSDVDDEFRVYDPWHHRWCAASEAGPTPEEIDWTGLDEAIARLDQTNED